MRRTAQLIGVAVLLASSATALAGPADAGTTSLTVTTLGRAGEVVRTMPRVVDITSAQSYSVTSGRSAKIPAGRYDVVVDIYDPKDNTDTVGAARVTVNGREKVTIDARRGRALRARLSPAAPAGYRQSFAMGVCSAGGFGILGYTLSDVLYVIPSTASTVELAYSSLWQPQDSSSTGPRYLAAATHHKGLPAGGTAVFKRSALARIDVHAQSGPVSGSPTIQLDGQTQDICASGTRSVGATATLPYSFTSYVTAGSWRVGEQGQDYLSTDLRTYRAGGHYSAILNHTVWGPRGQLPYVWDGRNLYLNVTGMFVDPTMSTYPAGARVTYQLSKGGRTILRRRTDGGATLAPVLKTRGWYTLVATATRHPNHPLPADALSTASSLRLHFYADPGKVAQVRGYVTGFRPVGLNANGQARANSVTELGLSLLRAKPDEASVRQLSDGVKRVQVWVSDNAGRTWRTVAVSHRGSKWTAKVRNGAGGYVSVRSTVTDIHGSSSTTTVVRAWRVG